MNIHQQNHAHNQAPNFVEDLDPPTIRVVEGWIGNWRISLRRRDTKAENLQAHNDYMNEIGD